MTSGHASLIILLALGACAQPAARRPGSIAPGPDGTIWLNASQAIVHGSKLRYEPQDYKNTLGFWIDPADWAQWPVRITRAGDYQVHILQGCGAGQGGSEVEISLGRSSLTFTVQETGHFQNFINRSVGTLHVPRPGRYLLQVRANKLASRAVMDLREVRLIPAAPQPD